MDSHKNFNTTHEMTTKDEEMTTIDNDIGPDFVVIAGLDSSSMLRPKGLNLHTSKSDGAIMDLPLSSDKERRNTNVLNLDPVPGIVSRSAPATPLITPASSMSRISEISVDRRLENSSRKAGGGVSSRRTVIVIAAFLVVGLIFVLSGILVLWNENHYVFKIAGGSFLTIGILSFIWCLFLQQKNFKKLVHELEKDMYFGHITDIHVLRRLLFYDPSDSKTR